MTTPAIDEDSEIMGSFTLDRTIENPKGVITNGPIASSGTFRSHAVVRKRPASATSPVRKDLTRAPLGWDHKWFRLQQGTGLCEIIGRQGGPGSRYQRYKGNGPAFPSLGPHTFTGLFSSPKSATSDFPFGVEQAARTKVLNKILDSDFMLGVTLVEAKKTASLLTSTASSIVGGITSFRRNARMAKGDFRRFIGEMRKGKSNTFSYKPVNSRTRGPWDRLLNDRRAMSTAIPEKWLEYTYGWKPLIMEADGLALAMADMLFDEGLDPYLVVKAGAEDKDEVFYPLQPFQMGVAFKAGLHMQVHSQCHYSIRYNKPVGMLADARGELGLGLAPTLWELTPYSFALDWVVGVGDWLNSMGAQRVADFVEGSRTYVQRVNVIDQTCVPIPNGSWQDQEARLPKATICSFGRMRREVLYSLPIPPIVPEIRNNLGLPQLASLLSLLVQSGAKPYLRT